MVREGSQCVRALGGTVVDTNITRLFVTLLSHTASAASRERMFPIQAAVFVPAAEGNPSGALKFLLCWAV